MYPLLHSGHPRAIISPTRRVTSKGQIPMIFAILFGALMLDVWFSRPHRSSRSERRRLKKLQEELIARNKK